MYLTLTLLQSKQQWIYSLLNFLPTLPKQEANFLTTLHLRKNKNLICSFVLTQCMKTRKCVYQMQKAYI